ncbi:MAG: hypothetical protein RLZZ450_7214 [Pseudomonadota bacterium]|jgi:AcrR family transcriptional regulator
MRKTMNKKPQGRPRRFDRDQALDAAMLLFWRHGYEGASIAQLTQAMGVNPPSLYAAFGSKEQLYIATLHHYLSTVGGAGIGGLETAPTAREGVAHLLREAAKAFTRPSYPPGCMIAVGSLRCSLENQVTERETAALRKLSQEVLTRRLVRARTEGELPARTPVKSLAAYYAAVVEGLSVQAQDGADRDELFAICAIAMRAWPDPR